MGFVRCGCMYVWGLGCVGVRISGLVMCVCVCVALSCGGVCMCGFPNVWVV